MVDDTIANRWNRSTRNGAASGTDRASLRPQSSQIETVRYFGVLEPVLNENQAGNTVGTASVGRGTPSVRGSRDRGRGRLRAALGKDR